MCSAARAALLEVLVDGTPAVASHVVLAARLPLGRLQARAQYTTKIFNRKETREGELPSEFELLSALALSLFRLPLPLAGVLAAGTRHLTPHPADLTG